MKKLWLALGATALLFIGSAIGGYVAYSRQADASRNASGTYSRATSNVVSGQVISSSLWNNTMGDYDSTLTNSLDRNGNGGMLAALRGVDGTVAAPAFSWTSETGSGLYRIGSSDVGLALSGTKVGEWTANGYRSANGAVATPSLSFFNDTGSGLYRIGSNDIGFAVNGTLLAEFAAQMINVTGGVNPRSAASPFPSSGKGLEISYLSGADTGTIQSYDRTGAAWKTLNVDASSIIFNANSAGTVKFQTGVAANGSGFKHARVSGCTTAATAGATCNVTLTWTTAFADANYTAVCSVDGSSGPAALIGFTNKLAASIQPAIIAVTANAATATTFDCIAVHD